MKNQQGVAISKQLFRVQIIVVVSLSCCVGLISFNAGWSLFLGGLVSIIPSVFFAHALFKHHGAQAAKKIVTSFYRGEAVKLALTFALFAVVFATLKVNGLSFFIGFIVAQLMFWVVPLLFNHRQK